APVKGPLPYYWLTESQRQIVSLHYHSIKKQKNTLPVIKNRTQV
ncbi:MAG: hypothetical protein ACI9C4_002168, partial [Paraglaciecola sp.]